MQQLKIKKSDKEQRQLRVLIALVEQHIKTGRPIGSNTLKESDFADLSSATIRNYFATLEEQGYLTQQHSSGGRLPTYQGYRFYAERHADSREITSEHQKWCHSLENSETREIAHFLQKASEELGMASNSAVFLSAPRFDHDFVIGLRLVAIDSTRCLCIMITDFGVIQTELLYVDTKLSAFSIHRIEEYFQWRLTSLNQPENLEPHEEALAQKIYNELMMRYLVGYSNFTDDEIYRTGFSRLLVFPEFKDPATLTTSLALFESSHSMRLLLRECRTLNRLKFWIGDDLIPYTSATPECCVAAIPYHVHGQPVGAVGLMTPLCVSYKEIFGLLHAFGESISSALTRNLYKFKIKFRQPHETSAFLQKEEHQVIGHSRLFLLEDQRNMT
jgi:heat-inducible transcriptional repressor